MKTFIITSVLVSIAFVHTGCLNLYQPLISEKEYVADKRITGNCTSGDQTVKIEEFGNSSLKGLLTASVRNENPM